MDITAIHLFRTNEHAIVKAEINGRFVTVIKERIDGAFSHIVEEGGMRKIVDAVEEIEALIQTPHQS